MAGRKPTGPGLVHQLDGSVRAKERLEVILETIAGRLPIKDACERLGIGEAMFHKLRTRVLMACVEELEPKPRGRPRCEATAEPRDVDELERELKDLRSELAAQDVRLEVASVLPQVMHPDAVKKTTENARLQRAWTARQQRRQRIRRPK